MKITIRQSGGFAGGPVGEPIVREASSLSPEKQAALRAALDRLTQLARNHHPVGSDFIQWEVLVEDGANRRTVSFADDGSDQAQQLTKAVQSIEAIVAGETARAP